jgi:hypothetical protein
MLRALPFQTIGDIGQHGLELHVYCPSCYSTRQLVDLKPWADRCFATARFRCTGTRYDSAPCRATGMPVVRPAELLPVGGPVTVAFLTCPRCIWEINHVRLDQPPWSYPRARRATRGTQRELAAVGFKEESGSAVRRGCQDIRSRTCRPATRKRPATIQQHDAALVAGSRRYAGHPSRGRPAPAGNEARWSRIMPRSSDNV